MPMITVIIPMYNESGIIEKTANTLSEYMQTTFEDYEILFSNDGSTDFSAELVEKLNLPRVRVVGYKDNRGKGAAIRHAVGEASGDLIMFTDADLAYGTEVIKRAYDILCGNSDKELLLGSRNLSKDGYDGYTATRRIMSKGYIKLLGIIGGFKLSDSQCGCKCFRADAAKDIFSRCQTNGFAFDLEVILWATALGYGICEIPVKIVNHKQSKINLIKDSLKMVRDVYKIRRSVKKQIRSGK